MPEHVPQQIAALAGAFAHGELARARSLRAHAGDHLRLAAPDSQSAGVDRRRDRHDFARCVARSGPSRPSVRSSAASPSGCPAGIFPRSHSTGCAISWAPAATIAALGGIESLLSAAVADGMTDTRHDSNQELLGQGIANLLTPLIGGIAATGAIARTAANIRSGARSPVAGIIHALALLAVALVAAPLAKYIPLATLSAILITVALRMAEWDTFAELWRGPRSDFAVMLATFLLTVVFDLTVGVGAGLAMAVVLFVRHMEEMAQVKLLTPESDIEMEGSNSLRGKVIPPGVVLYRIQGPLFFAAADKLEAALRGSGGRPKIVVFRMRHVPAMDATGLHAFEIAVEKMQRDHVRVLLTAVQPQPMKVMFAAGLVDRIGLENVCANIDEALARCATLLAVPEN